MPDSWPHNGVPTGRRVLRCDRCAKSTEATHADLMRFTRDGWPKCCGDTMGYFVEAPRPSATDTTPPDGTPRPPT